MASELIVHHRHGRQLNYCNRGMRAWLQRYGWPWDVFLREGIPASVLESNGDPQAMCMVELARKEEGEDQ